MSDRVKGFTVVLNRDLRDDDAAKVMQIIEMIRGVLSVTPLRVSSFDSADRVRIRTELTKKLLKVLDEDEERHERTDT
jgi:hypothetical protein